MTMVAADEPSHIFDTLTRTWVCSIKSAPLGTLNSLQHTQRFQKCFRTITRSYKEYHSPGVGFEFLILRITVFHHGVNCRRN